MTGGADHPPRDDIENEIKQLRAEGGVRTPKVPLGSGSPWMEEQALRLARQEAQIDAILGSEANELPVFPWKVLQAAAEQVKAYDAYHSTTMKGYRIPREVSDAIIAGSPLPGRAPGQRNVAGGDGRFRVTRWHSTRFFGGRVIRQPPIPI